MCASPLRSVLLLLPVSFPLHLNVTSSFATFLLQPCRDSFSLFHGKIKIFGIKAPNIELSIPGENCALRDNGEKDGLGWRRVGVAPAGSRLSHMGRSGQVFKNQANKLKKAMVMGRAAERSGEASFPFRKWGSSFPAIPFTKH